MFFVKASLRCSLFADSNQRVINISSDSERSWFHVRRRRLSRTAEKRDLHSGDVCVILLRHTGKQTSCYYAQLG